MADPLAAANAGNPSPFVNKLDTVNAVLESARRERAHRNDLAGANGRDVLTPACRVLVRNDTGGTLPAFSVLALGTPIISAVDFPYDVRRDPLFPGTAPAAATDVFAITIEPLTYGDTGRAVVMGVAVCDISVSDAAHTFAVPVVATTATLASATSGPVRIIWKETGTGTKRAVVLIGDGSGVTVQDEGSALPKQTTINFIGAGVTAADDAGNNRTNVTIPGSVAYYGRSVRPVATNATFGTGSWQDTPVYMRAPRAGVFLINVQVAFVDNANSTDIVAWSFRVYDTTNAGFCTNLTPGTPLPASALNLNGAATAGVPSTSTVVTQAFSLLYDAPTAATLTLQIFGKVVAGGSYSATLYYWDSSIGNLAYGEQTYMTYVFTGESTPRAPITWSTAGSHSDVVPAGATLARTSAWGAGGGGAGNSANMAGGGGGGAFSRGDWRAVSAGDALIGTVGTGGTAGVNGVGGAGSDTDANTGTVVAKGGAGGTSTAFAAAAGGLASASTGLTKYNGGAGGTLSNTPDRGTGGGGGGGSGGAGGAGGAGTGSTGGTAGAAGATDGGAGGAGSRADSPGVSAGAGTAPGGGGGGKSGGTGNTGGVGGTGKIYIEFA